MALTPPNADEFSSKCTLNKSDYADPSIEFGKILASPPPNEEIVISGISGEYPNSNNVQEFAENLFNKVDMVSDDNRRWDPEFTEIPQRTGKIYNISKFDAGYFGFNYQQSKTADPMLRKLLEAVISAIFDAGLHPNELAGTNTGVFIGACFSETEKTWFIDNLEPNSYAITGCTRSMLSNRISYFLKLKGPSYVCDTACSSSMYALEHAYKSIRLGLCDRAIVGGTNLCLNPYVSLQFKRLGVLSSDGKCKSFDKNANGYARSEAISAIILQKVKESNRLYCTIIHAKTNCDGYKNSGITFPSSEMQIRLLREFYQECNLVKPSDLTFLEAHGTGTKVGDPEELLAIETILLPDRTTPLSIGTVKSNIGHTEPSSGMCAITKVIIATETGLIPPNSNFIEPNPDCKALLDGRLKVITEPTPLKNEHDVLIGINNFGFGGGNCHVVLKSHIKTKLKTPKHDIPRLICVSGRTMNAVDFLLDDIINNDLDVEYIRLLHNIFRYNISEHSYKGYLLATNSGEVARSVRCMEKITPKLVLCFGDVPDDMAIIPEFLSMPTISTSIQRLDQHLIQHGMSASAILQKCENQAISIKEKILKKFFLQVLLADLIKGCGIVPDSVFGVNKGLSLGELVSAYFKNAVSLKVAVNCAVCIAFTIGTDNSCSKNVVDMDISVLVAEKGSRIAIELYQNLDNILKINDTMKSTITNKLSECLLKPFDVNAILKYNQKIKTDIYVIYEVGNGEIAHILKSKLKKNLRNHWVNTGLNFNDFLISLGRLHELGFSLHLHNIYPKVELPVSRGTSMIAPKIKWNHQNDWGFKKFSKPINDLNIQGRNLTVALTERDCEFLGGHVIDGRTLFPATGYLYEVWKTLAIMHNMAHTDIKVSFENCKFIGACALQKDWRTKLTITIQRLTGQFEVTEAGEALVSGIVKRVFENEMPSIPFAKDTPNFMDTKDIYKELRLRGYNYKGMFEAIKSCDSSKEYSEITWRSNWVSFMDAMLQMKIMQENSRMLCVPTGIQKVLIDPHAHLEMIELTGKENPDLPVFISKNTGIIRCGGIEFMGLKANSILRRKYFGNPILEKYVFIPNYATLKLEQAIRVNMQILLENLLSLKVKIVELLDSATPEVLQTLGPIISNVLEDQPLIKPDIKILSEVAIEVANIKVENKSLAAEKECSMVIASKIFKRPNILELALESIQNNGFILSRESLEFDVSSVDVDTLSIITGFSTDSEQLIMFKKKTTVSTPRVINIKSEDKKFTWLPDLQSAVKHEKHIIIFSQGESLSGIQGLATCIRREPGGSEVKLVYSPNSLPEFDPELPVYKEQLSKNMAVNIFKDGQWGTYRHLLLEKARQIEMPHCYLNSVIVGDLSSLTWLEGNLKNNSTLQSDRVLVSVYYASLNFKDLMVASGRINIKYYPESEVSKDCMLGLEFAGLTQSGKRVFGTLPYGACSSLVSADAYLIVDIPDYMTMEEAATIPVVYSTNYYALMKCAKIKKGDTILIHSGAGGIGQSAIRLALYFGCTVYTTVGTQEKRDFLKTTFPQLTDEHISSSRNTYFEEEILHRTNGRGVDIVLNSLADDKLFASVRCLARGGKFIEIGKYNLINDSELHLLFLKKGASFHGVFLDPLYNEIWLKKKVCNFLRDGLKKGYIKPLNRTIFNMDQAEDAFRYIGTGKHIGKVLIKLQDEKQDATISTSKPQFFGVPRYLCDSDKTFIICGGLGGFGLELADWLILRGCRKLILSSRNGIKTGYQAYRISIWKSHGCTVSISTEDITTYEGCLNIIKMANDIGPVQGIFNLAVVLKDSLLTNQNEESFVTSFRPKAYATEFLDHVSRTHCPLLRDFVVFSSVACGKGNAGQTNYGMSNSVMEKICERRKREGFPGLAIQWGAIGDVGLVAEMMDGAVEKEIGGTLPQKISNCFEVLDILLQQNEAAVVSSIVVAEKKLGLGEANMVEAVANILGIKDMKAVSLEASLAEIGMDSMTAVEIKQTLEREYNTFLPASDIKTLTFSKLIDIQAQQDNHSKLGTKGEQSIENIINAIKTNIPVVFINSEENRSQEPNATLVLFPGIEGVITVMEPLYKNLLANLIGIQYSIDSPYSNIPDMAASILPTIQSRLVNSKSFNLIGHSFGGIVALQVAAFLEEDGCLGTIICIDSSPEYMISLIKLTQIEVDDKCPVKQENSNTLPNPLKLLPQEIVNNITFIGDYQQKILMGLQNRMKAIVEYTPHFKLKSKVILFKPTLSTAKFHNLDADYGLSKYCENPVEVRTFEGNHTSIFKNEHVATAINEYFSVENVET
ncbi:fatty acid synthase-like [Euwallacea fornicatus]|uniref:fatty acid synthase-like n=1 Tax=Euwallacea fornicatus TaxID=995702 RepID=UPI00338E19B3